MNREFFDSAADEGSWAVRKVDAGKFMGMPSKKKSGDGQDGMEREPLLRNGR